MLCRLSLRLIIKLTLAGGSWPRGRACSAPAQTSGTSGCPGTYTQIHRLEDDTLIKFIYIKLSFKNLCCTLLTEKFRFNMGKQNDHQNVMPQFILL